MGALVMFKLAVVFDDMLDQKVWRGQLARRIRVSLEKERLETKLMMQNYSAAVIQKTWRRHRCQTQYRQIRAGFIKMQALWRGYAQRQRYQRLLRSVVLVQSCVRRNLARKEFLRKREMIIQIQRQWKTYTLRQGH